MRLPTHTGFSWFVHRLSDDVVSFLFSTFAPRQSLRLALCLCVRVSRCLSVCRQRNIHSHVFIYRERLYTHIERRLLYSLTLHTILTLHTGITFVRRTCYILSFARWIRDYVKQTKHLFYSSVPFLVSICGISLCCSFFYFFVVIVIVAVVMFFFRYEYRVKNGTMKSKSSYREMYVDVELRFFFQLSMKAFDQCLVNSWKPPKSSTFVIVCLLPISFIWVLCCLFGQWMHCHRREWKKIDEEWATQFWNGTWASKIRINATIHKPVIASVCNICSTPGTCMHLTWSYGWQAAVLLMDPHVPARFNFYKDKLLRKQPLK